MKKLLAYLKQSVKEEEMDPDIDLDCKYWDSCEGILLSVNEAKQLIQFIENKL